jgi:thiol-disulfide isomerase/thioredoxin
MQVDVLAPTAPAGNNARVMMYGASWCPWCKKQLQELKKGRGKYTYVVHMCDTTHCDDSITTLPTLVLLADDRPVVRLLGYHTSEALERELGV